jgi:hypothetical protein
MELLMSIENKITFLSEQLAYNIEAFTKKRNRNKTKAFLIKFAITGLGGTTTVLLGLQGVGLEHTIRNITLVTSALVTLLSALDTFFNHRGLWIRYTKTMTDLRTIESDLKYALATGIDSISEDIVDELYHRYQQTLSETNKWWLQIREDDGTQSDRVHGSKPRDP